MVEGRFTPPVLFEAGRLLFVGTHRVTLSAGHGIGPLNHALRPFFKPVDAPLLRRTAVRQHRRHQVNTLPNFWWYPDFRGRDGWP